MKSVLYITSSQLIEVYCAFLVEVKNDVNRLRSGDFVWVKDIKYDKQGSLIFVVNNELYYAKHFEVVL